MSINRTEAMIYSIVSEVRDKLELGEQEMHELLYDAAEYCAYKGKIHPRR